MGIGKRLKKWGLSAKNVATIGATLIGGPLAGAAVYSAASAMSKPKTPQMSDAASLLAPPTLEDPSIAQAQQDELLELQKRRGRNANIFGTGDDSSLGGSSVAKKLLGG